MILSFKSHPDKKVMYFKSGWNNIYHIIVEHGDGNLEVDAVYQTLDEIAARFDVSIEEILQGKSYLISKEKIAEYPNDADLGKYVRQLTNTKWNS